MAYNFLKLHTRTFTITNPSTNPYPQTKTIFTSFRFSTTQCNDYNISSSFPSSTLPYKSQRVSSSSSSLYLHCSLSSSSCSSSTPPTSKEEALLLAKTCLSTTLDKHVNNPKLTGKLKKLKQPRYRIEIPVVDDDSPPSLSQLAFDLFKDLPIRRKGSSSVKILMLWPDAAFSEAAVKAFELPTLNQVEHIDLQAVGGGGGGDGRFVSSADVSIFMAPEKSQLGVIKMVTESLYPKPVVIFNPRWAFEEEQEADDFGDMIGFVRSFEVIYSFLGLEVMGILSKRKGMIFKCVRNGILSGEKWNVFVEEEGEMKVVSRFAARPSIGEVETVLYNLMAMDSPITKSAKFLRDLLSNVTGKK